MPAGAFLYQLIVFLAVAFFWLAISAAILRGACSIFNRMARGDSVDKAVGEPTFGWAIVVQLVAGLLSFAVYYGVMVGTRGMQRDLAIPDALMPFASAGLSLAISLVVFPLAYAFMLPTTLPRAVVVYLLGLVITVVLAVILGLVIALPWLVLSMR